MADSNHAQVEDGHKSRPIVQLSSEEARSFFLKHESYCSIELPKYFRFDDLLKGVANELEGKRLSSLRKKTPRDFDDVNHPILHNKDGRYAWRPLELIHPAIYVDLVNSLTTQDHWNLIRERFDEFNSSTGIRCLSLPVEALTNEKDRAAQITQWWREVEQKSIESALDYEFVVHTDVVDCYSAIYTHSVAWAIHTKPEAKKKRSKNGLIGNVIDNLIQDMRQGQTNGIPQGSVLMDFIAEMVLGYADIELTNKIDSEQINDYQILRYRDDYRIFVNNPQDGERILKCLTEVMIDLGMKLNPSKTEVSGEVIRSSIKRDKLSWTFRSQRDRNLQKHSLMIHDHGMQYPNSGSVARAMQDYLQRITKITKCNSPLPLISIVVDIAYRNPRTYHTSAAILSYLIHFLETNSEKRRVIEKVRRKFSQLPNTGHMEIWLQRISYPFDSASDFDEPLCKLVRKENAEIWNSDWISSQALRRALDPKQIVDFTTLVSMPSTVALQEVELFDSAYSYM